MAVQDTDRSAFLSVRVPSATRNRVKAIAAARGQTVQELVGGLVERFLAEQDRRPPARAEVVARLRRREAELRARGVASLSVFGSVARGEAGPERGHGSILKPPPPAGLDRFHSAIARYPRRPLFGRWKEVSRMKVKTQVKAGGLSWTV